ncbi:hypothetical protein CMQ_5161 [Grosmannia clavigera kw1407]|uniref:Uncharacterized protein n=1 Tax=Grosmannia clavigera (strain kw1407 / UAMH 11150) TaxID=655863 RepID=F0XB57_GROCL|nr:uncharacterized protein CMQ_5161 [Grosmannia clavigera kw1407]EFX04899.1 hypothetical protein CMQ_5161 [Grosmannia clavigera kw1407]
MYLIRLIYGSRLFFADVPKQPFVKRPVDAVVLPTERVVTRVKTCRIPAAQVEAIVTACRAHNTTFTPLLIVMINLVLATEHYPAAKLGLSFCAIDTRPCLPALPTTGKQAKDIMNASASIMIVHRLEAIRRAASPAPTSNAMPALTLATPAGGGLVAVDADAIWKPVQEYGDRLRNGMEGPVPTIVRNVLQGKMAGEDLEDMLNRGMPSLGLVMKNGFLVSNLGPFSTPPAETRGCCGFWQVSEVQFSAAVTQASAGASGIVFNVAGVKGGDTIINASYQDGALRARSVEAVLSSVAAKMVYVANTTLATKK